MVKSLFIGNLPWSVNSEELQAKFAEQCQVISARVVADRETGRSKGFGFVDVEDGDAEKAIQAMNGYSWGGREIAVNEARPKAGS